MVTTVTHAIRQDYSDHVSFGGPLIDVSADILVDCRYIHRLIRGRLSTEMAVDSRLSIDR